VLVMSDVETVGNILIGAAVVAVACTALLWSRREWWRPSKLWRSWQEYRWRRRRFESPYLDEAEFRADPRVKAAAHLMDPANRQVPDRRRSQ